MLKGGSVYRIITDHLGSVRLVVDAQTGAIAQEMSYDEFGRVLSDTNPGFQPFGYAGGLWDADTGLVRFGARDYDPEVGRWTSKEPKLFASGPNLYVYGFNNPVNLADVTGLDVCVHTNRTGYEHQWIEIGGDPERSYGLWPAGFPFGGPGRIANPDPEGDRATNADVVCVASSASEDDQLERWIRDKYPLNQPLPNYPYIFGVQDCRHFVGDALVQLDEIQNKSPWNIWEHIGPWLPVWSWLF